MKAAPTASPLAPCTIGAGPAGENGVVTISSSEADIARLRRVQLLTQDGVNLAGVKRIMAMEEDLQRMRARIAQLEARLQERPIPMPGSRTGMAIVPLASVFAPPWPGGRA